MSETSPPPALLWQIEARKYDGSLHYTLPAHLIEDDGERLWVRSQPGGPLHHVTRGWTRPITRPSDMFFWRGRWYNVYLNYDDDGLFNHFYCNAGMPPVLSDHAISFVDLDLDVQIWPDGRYAVLDEDEFLAHAAQFAYPAEVQRGARQAVEALLALWRAKTPPFDR
jgi:protein associated with RNAse G/E